MQLYVRIRGRAHGPFEETKLLEMVAKGQLTRVHQVSVDGREWKKASEFPEIFDAAKVTLAAPVASKQVQNAQSSQAQASGNVPSTEQASTTANSEWYYSDGAASQGPISFRDLKQLCDSGSLHRDSLVWKADFDTWRPAGRIPGLFSPTVVTSSTAANTTSDNAPESVTQALAGGSGWVMLLSLALLTVSITYFALFVFLLAGSGSFNGEVPIDGPVKIISSFSSLVTSVIFAVAGYLLFRYSRETAKLRYVQSWGDVAIACRTLKAFWAFLGVILIVYVSVISLAIFVIIAMSGSMT